MSSVVVRRRRIVAVAAGLGSAVLGALPWAAADRGDMPSRRPAARGAVRLVNGVGAALPGRWQSWADQSLMPTVPRRVRVLLKRCPDRPRSAGCVYTRRPRTIYLRLHLRDPRGVLLHDLG